VTESESCRRSNSRSETSLVPDDDQETGAMETLGLRNPLDHPSDAENINTGWWIARSVSTRRSDRRDSRYLENLDFGFYDHVSFKENAGLGVTSIGRWLGVSHRVGGLMSYWIPTIKGAVISHTTVQSVTALEKETDEVKAAVVEFDSKISRRFKEEEDLT
jgi:hypothetical protein